MKKRCPGGCLVWLLLTIMLGAGFFSNPIGLGLASSLVSMTHDASRITSSGADLTVAAALDRLAHGYSLQIHCDSEYRDGNGDVNAAASFVVHAHNPQNKGVAHGFKGLLIPSAISALEAEVRALQAAVAWVELIV